MAPEPLTGFYRDGCCNTGPEDHGVHTVCAVMTAPFLAFSRARGNDLSTPMPQYGFAGLREGDIIVIDPVARTLDVEPRTLLVHALRNELSLTGTKVGCDTSSERASSVLTAVDDVRCAISR